MSTSEPSLGTKLYVYVPLLQTDSGEHQIRLVRLLPATDRTADIFCGITHCSLSKDLVYEAVSYVWGDPTITTPISLDGSEHHVTTNLALALRYLRLADESRVLWVDAICINQNDLEEKGHQVANMRKIYVTAERTLVWLGEEGDAQLAIDYCRSLPTMKGSDVSYESEYDSQTSDESTMSEGADGEDEEVGVANTNRWWDPNFNPRDESSLSDDLEGDVEEWRMIGAELQVTGPSWQSQPSTSSPSSISDISLEVPNMDAQISSAWEDMFLKRPWWRRLWVVQEITHSQPVIVFIGDIQIDLDDLYRLWRQSFHKYQEHAGSNDEQDQEHKIWSSLRGFTKVMYEAPIAKLRYCRRMLNGGGTGGSLPLLLSLIQFRNREAYDPKDKVFGFLGFSSQQLANNIIVDYNMSVEEVFTQSARAQLFVKGEVGVMVLLIAEGIGRKICCDPLPSWVPDLRLELPILAAISANTGSQFASLIGTQGFNDSDIGSKQALHVSDSNILSLVGLYVGTVTAIYTLNAPAILAPALDGQSIRLMNYDTDVRLRGLFTEEHLRSDPKEISMLNTSWAPSEVQIGDFIILAKDCPLPLVLRKDGEYYLFVGSCVLINSQIRPLSYRMGFNIFRSGFSDIMLGSLSKEIGKTRHLEVFEIH